MRFPSRRRLLLVAVPALVVLIAVGFGVWWFFFRSDAPPEADIDAASETLEQRDDQGGAADNDAADGTGGDTAEGSGVEGTWVVDPTIGEFDSGAEVFTGTYAGYRIDEELAQIGANTAVGRTPDVTGEITIEGDQLAAADFEVDMTTLMSDEDLRDNALTTRGLETNTYPAASFSLTEPVMLPADATSGEQFAVMAVGDLTLHGVTNQVTVELDAQLDDDAIAVVGSAPVVLADYDIDGPSAPVVVSVADEGVFEFQIFLTRA